MPTPKQVETYHELFFAVCRSAILHGTCTLAYRDAESAARARRRFYAFREAMYASPSYSPDMAMQLPSVSFIIDGTSLVVTSKGTSI